MCVCVCVCVCTFYFKVIFPQVEKNLTHLSVHVITSLGTGFKNKETLNRSKNGLLSGKP